MSSDHTQQELPPGVLIHPASDRRLAAEHWLLSTLAEHRRARARLEWREEGVAMLPLGTLFSAVRLPIRLITAITGPLKLPEIDAFLADALDGGPVVCDLNGLRYYALVPASVPRTWRDAAHEWRDADADVLGRDTLLGVPRLDATEATPARTSYWSVPMESMGMLCAPLKVARLIAAAQDQMARDAIG
ncbi:MAG TPA: hypothetical protein VIP28_10695 [Nocardioides sp.]